MAIRYAVIATLLLAGSGAGAAAQGPDPIRWAHANSPMVRLQPTSPAVLRQVSLVGAAPTGAEPSLADSARIAATHWKTGAVIGGGVLGVLGAWTFVGLCGMDGPCHHATLSAVGGFALGGLLGFGLGALVGGQFPVGSP